MHNGRRMLPKVADFPVMWKVSCSIFEASYMLFEGNSRDPNFTRLQWAETSAAENAALQPRNSSALLLETVHLQFQWMNVVSDAVQFQFRAVQSGFLMRRITAAPTNPFLITQCTAGLLVLPNLAVQNTPSSKNWEISYKISPLKRSSPMRFFYFCLLHWLSTVWS